VNAGPLLKKLAKGLHDCKLEAIMVGNAAAALQGAPVTTLDVDFMIRNTKLNVEKIRRLAALLKARVTRPYEALSNMYRLEHPAEGWQVDFLVRAHGVRSFEGLRARSDQVKMGRHILHVANLRDILAAKKSANRPKDRAVLHVLENTLHEKQEQQKK
jgi:hypothetical protein